MVKFCDAVLGAWTVGLGVSAVLRFCSRGEAWGSTWWVDVLGFQDYWWEFSLLEGLLFVGLVVIGATRLRDWVCLLLCFSFTVVHAIGFAIAEYTCGCFGGGRAGAFVACVLSAMGLVAAFINLAIGACRHDVRVAWTKLRVSSGAAALVAIVFLAHSVGGLPSELDALASRLEKCRVWVVSSSCEECTLALSSAGRSGVGDLVLLVRSAHEANAYSASEGRALVVSSSVWWHLLKGTPPTRYRVAAGQWDLVGE